METKIYKLDTKESVTVIKESYSGELIRMYNLRDDGLLFITDINVNMPSFCETIIRAPEDDDFDTYYYQFKTDLEESNVKV